jgi:hypothetical protein
MYFDARKGYRFNRIKKRKRCVRERSRVDEHSVERPSRSSDFVEERAFVIGLKSLDRGTKLRSPGGKARVDFCECRGAVDFRFPGAQELEIRP